MVGESLPEQQHGESVTGWEELASMPAFEDGRFFDAAEEVVRETKLNFEKTTARNKSLVEKTRDGIAKLETKMAAESDEWRVERYAQQIRDRQRILRVQEGWVEFARVPTVEDGEVQTLESVADHKIAKETKAYLERLKAGKLTQEYKEKYAERVTALSELRGFLGFQRKVMQEELVEEVDEPVQAEEESVSYHFEAGIAHDGVTITVGQEIPDDWFEAGVLADVRNESGFGINWKESPRIDDYLQQALNVEFSKLSEDERRHYNYSSISKKIKAEAKETKRIPDIAAIIQENRM